MASWHGVGYLPDDITEWVSDPMYLNVNHVHCDKTVAFLYCEDTEENSYILTTEPDMAKDLKPGDRVRTVCKYSETSVNYDLFPSSLVKV